MAEHRSVDAVRVAYGLLGGAQLFISPRAAEWHLRRVFTKLGIHSRKELHAAALATPATVGTAPGA